MSTKPDPLIGQVIAGRYEVVRVIGKGGMGSIYEVRHLKLRRTFALKKLSAQLADEPEALARFQREADVVASLRHPNVVEIIDWETLEDGSPCMIIEYLKGEDLDRRLARGRLGWPAIAQIVDAVLAALVVAHKAGIVHRDLKPQNIFLALDDAGEEHVKLLDFGVSKIRGSDSLATADQRLLGTPLYMSPEQADGRQDQIGPATDVWAMGAILYEMATGKCAFEAPSTPSILYRICHGEVEPMAALRPDAPRRFVELVKLALSRDESRRIRSIEVLRRGLREALAELAPGAFATPMRSEGTPSQPSLAPPPPSQTTLSHAAGQNSMASLPGRSRRGLVVALSATVALGAAGLVVTLSRARHGAPTVAPLVEPDEPSLRASTLRPQEPKVTPLVTLLAKPKEAPAPAARSIVVHVRPHTAQLELDGYLVSGNEVPLPEDGRAHQLRISAPGFRPEMRALDGRTATSIEIALQPKPVVRAHGASHAAPAHETTTLPMAPAPAAHVTPPPARAEPPKKTSPAVLDP